MNPALPTGEFELVLRTHREAFERLYRDHHAFVWRCARRMGVSEGDADDVLQDVFIVAYRRLDQLSGDVKPSSWLFGILRNVVRNRSRGQRRRDRRMQAFATHVHGRERSRQRRETELGERVLAREAVEAFLLALDRSQREVFILAELEGYTGREIATTLDVNPNTVHSRLRLARRAFCRHFHVEPQRPAVTAALAPTRERPPQPSPRAQAHSLGLILAAVASPWRGAAASGGVAAWLGSKASAAALGLSLTAAAVAGLSLRATAQTSAASSTYNAGHVAGVRSALASRPAAPLHAPSPAPQTKAQDTSRPAPAPASAAQLERPPPSATGPDPAEQLRRARASLVEGDPNQALAALDVVPETELRLFDQRVATRVAALCKLDDPRAAEAALAPLRDRVSSATLVARIDHACW